MFLFFFLFTIHYLRWGLLLAPTRFLETVLENGLFPFFETVTYFWVSSFSSYRSTTFYSFKAGACEALHALNFPEVDNPTAIWMAACNDLQDQNLC